MEKKSSYLFIGLALFSMFFGSGNLIFPLYIGQLAQDHFLSATLGFLLTAVAFPFFGVIAMVIFQGNYTEFFGCLGKRTGLLLTALLLTVWIPLGSAPRCIALAYASTSTYFSLPPLWVWSLCSCLLIALIVWKKNRMLDFLGYVLTPMLLLCLFIISVKGLWGANFSMSTFEHSTLFMEGLKEGYNTMDLIAAFFFSASVIDILQKDGSKDPMKITMKACAVGISLLGVVYFALISLAAAYSGDLEGIPKEQLLSHVALIVMGPQLGIIAMVTIVLACLTTLLALVSVYSDFLSKSIFRQYESRKQLSLCCTLLGTFILSTLGLSGITFITAPILEVFYPLLIVLIAYNTGVYLNKGLSRTRSCATSD
ncbi:MAG: LIVCS family branched-chain amino acid:cation transporter [Chlamydiales bacterium]|jgi:LIVCS family branched-chain amino acid:cation transporter